MQRALSTTSTYIPVTSVTCTHKLLLELFSMNVSWESPYFLYFRPHRARVRVLLLQQEVRCVQPYCPRQLWSGSTSRRGPMLCTLFSLVTGKHCTTWALLRSHWLWIQDLLRALEWGRSNRVPVSLLLLFYFCHCHGKSTLRVTGHRRRMKIT